MNKMNAPDIDQAIRIRNYMALQAEAATGLQVIMTDGPNEFPMDFEFVRKNHIRRFGIDWKFVKMKLERGEEVTLTHGIRMRKADPA
jgi:hypothetical protein